MFLAEYFSLCNSIRFKLTLCTFVLVVVLTTGLSLLVLKAMDEFLLKELFARGAAIAMSAATPAGYSILSQDLLALDNLAAKMKSSQEDVGYVVIVGSHGKVLAHSDVEMVGKTIEEVQGTVLVAKEPYTVTKIAVDSLSFYHFKAPILFAGKNVGEIRVGIDANTLEASRVAARKKILFISLLVLLLGVAGTFFLSRFITAPVKRLAEGVSTLKSGQPVTAVRITARDELGDLTRNFNEMAQVITDQKNSLALYARDLEESYLSTVRILAASIDARDNYTLGHSARVANLSIMVGKKLDFKAAELKDLALSCFLHDLGKIRVPDFILKKTGPLTDEEYQCIRRHPEHGAEILRLGESLHRYIPSVLHHHEWYNGSGYPAGLKGEEIPLFASILTLADSYDAMTTSRPYRVGLAVDAALAEMKRCRGTQFSPRLTDIFVACVEECDDTMDHPILYGAA